MTVNPWAFAADIIKPTSDQWKPLAHQLPPNANWFVYAIIGGRGCGKTATLSRMLHEHAMGPPCLPHVKGGHWIGIIAPTIGDAVTSVVDGPSGLRGHDPGLKLRQTVGGSTVTWSNGAQAKLFGAHTPDDVERLRSGGNRCVAAGTLITTKRGQVPIEDVAVGDMALTRAGWRKVTQVWDNGRKQTIEIVTTANRRIRLTPDHKVWANRAWAQAQNLSAGDTLEACLESTAVSTSRSGKRHTARSRKDMRSTIGTMTRGTTGSRTSSVSRARSTGRGTTRSEAQTGIARVGRLLSRSVETIRSYTPAMAVELSSWLRGGLAGVLQNVARLTMSDQALANCGTLSHASSARSHIPTRSTTARLGSAALSAGTELALPLARPGAIKATLATDVGTPPRMSDSVASIATTSQEASTYDLTVDEHHEYFANGVLISNCFVGAEELAAWRYLEDCWQHMRYGLRVGPHPRVVVATTPKTRKLIKKLFKDSKDPKNRVFITHATTNDNPYLPDDIKEELYKDYGGTRLGRQELEGLLIEDVEGALWSAELLDEHRLRFDDIPDRFDTIVVAVDPQAKLLSDVTGIIVVGVKNRWMQPGILRPDQPHGFVLGDYSIGGRPEVWAKTVKRAYRDFRANYVVAEVNNGGEMVKSTIHTADPALPVTDVWASRGKAIRAEPVSYLYEQGRIHHVGDFPKLEDQMTSWDASDPPKDWSPDRMDAMVWGFSKTLVSNAMMSNSQVNDKRLEGRR